MDASKFAFQGMIFLIVLGLLLQLFGLIPGIFNLNMFQAGSGSIVAPVTGKLLWTFEIPFIPKPLADLINVIIILLGAYLGLYAFGIIRGTSVNPGYDFIVMLKIIAIAVLFGILAPVYDILVFFISLGAIGQIIALFIGFIYFLVAYAYIYSKIT